MKEETGSFRKSILALKEELVRLGHDLGDPARDLAILGEGNISACSSRQEFLVKASGSSLATLSSDQLVEVRIPPVLEMLETQASDEEIAAGLEAAKIHPEDLRPSVETLFHALLLSFDSIDFVAHTHPARVNQILCSRQADAFAQNRLFPDEVVCCGPKSLLIDYQDPGAKLAVALRDGWKDFVSRHGFQPRVILIRNHGLIVVGRTAAGVLGTTLMAEKAARVFLGALQAGGPIFMKQDEVERIASRQDEHYRQRQLKM